MQRSNINHGPFTLMVSLCGEYHVAPGGIAITRKAEAERIAALYGRIMQERPAEYQKEG